MKFEEPRFPDTTAMQTFSDVTVMPTQDRKGPILRGGPIWPDWDQQVLPRHCRRHAPVDACPDAPTEIVTTHLESGIWVGPVYWHFGHQIAEFSTRILQSVQERGEDKLIFGVMPQMVGKVSWEDLPGSFKSIAAWFGVTKEMVMLCHAPLHVKKLRVAPQGEHMGRVPPTEAYLDLLDANWKSKGIEPPQNDLLYVSRAKLKSHFGGHAGATYLDSILIKAGIKVIYPETLSLEEQLTHYMGAKNLMFAEGSAIHGLQLLGRGLGNITVLNRRQHTPTQPRRMAAPQIGPRCKSLAYFDVVAHQLALYGPNGKPLGNSAISLFDVEKLWQSFAEIGIDLETLWDEDAFQRHQMQDMRDWIVSCWKWNGGRLEIEAQDHLLADLAHTGLNELADFFKATMVKD